MSIQDPPQDGPAAALPVIAPDAGAGADASRVQPEVLPEVAASLSDALRAMYDNVVDEPLPDAFALLLSRLDESDAGLGAGVKDA